MPNKSMCGPNQASVPATLAAVLEQTAVKLALSAICLAAVATPGLTTAGSVGPRLGGSTCKA